MNRIETHWYTKNPNDLDKDPNVFPAPQPPLTVHGQ
ncbi:hypothetical protein DERF_008634 [Dermatophagoides farinae]|uniref:Uncharacterized protein n=1 Tax=Dermatophagoides farinae TaxID=6954 RepID=A0A922I2R2_DERFA|nr:hypothetical protein DERF_008634 [Dermatophagoides farinae]